MAFEAVVEDQSEHPDSSVERRQVLRVQHTGYDVTGQRVAHRGRQRPATSGSGRSRAVVGDQKANEFGEGRGANDAALEDRSEQLYVV